MKETTRENQESQMRKGILEFCILLVISKEKAYASDIIGALREADLLVVEGTLYPLLSRLRTEGMLEYEWKESKAGPPRKYYFLTPKGKESLASAKRSWNKLYESVNALAK